MSDLIVPLAVALGMALDIPPEDVAPLFCWVVGGGAAAGLVVLAAKEVIR